MYVSLCSIANDSLVVLAGGRVSLDVDAEGTVEFEFQSAIPVSLSLVTHGGFNLHSSIFACLGLDTPFDTLLF